MPWFILLLALAGAAVVIPRLVLVRRFAGGIADPADAPSRSAAIVFGAGLRRDGTPTLVLADRVAVAASLYQQGRVQTLLLSGSSRGLSYDEAEAMRTLAIKLGVEPQDILVDNQGTRTLTTCLRARQVFGIQSALLVTQRFHLPRALALCQAAGIEADGVQADLSGYSMHSRWIWELRELPASLVAVIDAARIRSVTRHGAEAAARPDSGDSDGS